MNTTELAEYIAQLEKEHRTKIKHLKAWMRVVADREPKEDDE